jgi:hypothetical protein
MVAVAQAPPAEIRRLVLVRTTPAVRYADAAVPAATYRRRRIAAGALVTGVVVTLVLCIHLLLAPSAATPGAAGDGRAAMDGPVHVVQPGDTFWGIAQALRPNDDPRPLVARLVAAHGSPVLVVGERIRLPAGG